MDQRLKGKIWNHGIPRRKQRHKAPPTWVLVMVSWMWYLKFKQLKQKINVWDNIKLKSFCRAKETIHRVKRQPVEWDKIPANRVFDNGLISKIQREFIQLSSRKTTQLKQGQRTWTDASPKKTPRRPTDTWEDAQGNASQNHNEMLPPTRQNGHDQKTQMRDTQCCRGCGGKEPSCSAAGIVNGCSHL